jgi:hypothetical protein
MRTTLDLPDELFRQVKAKAAVKGTTIKELLTRYVEIGLRQPDASPSMPGKRSRLPVIKRASKTPIRNVTPELQARLDEEEDRAKLHRSLGR